MVTHPTGSQSRSILTKVKVTRLSWSGHYSSIVSPSHQGRFPPNWKVVRLGKISW